MHEAISPEFAAAIVAMQGSIEGAKKGKVNPHLKNKYADLASCWDAVEDALQKNGLAVLQPLCESPAGFVGVNTKLIHSPTGEILSEKFFVPVKDATNAQAYGSSVTYGRRYGLCSLLGIRNADDDGNAAAGTTGGGADRKMPTKNPEVSAGQLRQNFSQLTELSAMKDAYTAAKTANIQEPAKSYILDEMSKAIKAKMKLETK